MFAKAGEPKIISLDPKTKKSKGVYTDKAGVYTSTEYPPEFFISLHNELSYSTRWPSRLA